MIPAALAHHLSEGGLKTLTLVVYHLALDALFNIIAWFGRAVVVEVIVAVNLVLRLEVLNQSHLELAFLVVGKVQNLFGNAASPFLVVWPELVERICCKLIVGKSENKSE